MGRGVVDRDAELTGLMLRGLDGDAAAWRVLLTELRGSLTVYFRRRLIGREADAEDLVQECLIAIHGKRATFDRRLRLSAWVFAIARYKLIDHLRRQGRTATAPLDDDGSILAAHTVEDGVVRRDLGRLLSILPDRQRRLIEDVRLAGFSMAEAAARNGYTEGAAKVSVHRAMKVLTAEVSDHED